MTEHNMIQNIPEFLDTRQVAELLGISEIKLKKDRAAGKGLPFAKLGGRVLYRRTEIERYLELVTVRPPLPPV